MGIVGTAVWSLLTIYSFMAPLAIFLKVLCVAAGVYGTTRYVLLLLGKKELRRRNR
jgi:hypothetical protein